MAMASCVLQTPNSFFPRVSNSPSLIPFRRRGGLVFPRRADALPSFLSSRSRPPCFRLIPLCASDQPPSTSSDYHPPTPSDRDPPSPSPLGHLPPYPDFPPPEAAISLGILENALLLGLAVLLCRMGFSVWVALFVSAVLKVYFEVKKNLTASYNKNKNSNVRSMHKTVNILLDYEAKQCKSMLNNSLAMAHKVRQIKASKKEMKDSMRIQSLISDIYS